MESDQNQVNFTTPVSTEDKELNCVSSALNLDTSTMLENMSDMKDDWLRNLVLRREDATESNLDQMMDKLMGILDETITILGADVSDDVDSGYYALSDPNVLSETVVLGDVVAAKQNSRNMQTVGCQTEDRGENLILTASKNEDGSRSGLNEIVESLMIVLMLFSLYFLLSSMV